MSNKFTEIKFRHCFCTLFCLLLPVSAIAEYHAQLSLQTKSYITEPEVTHNTMNTLAHSASTVGSVLGNNNAVHSAARMAHGMVMNSVNTEIESWLGQFATAKINMNIDDNIHLDGTAIDLLFPLYDNKNNLLFSEWGYRNQDRRNTANIGVGGRTFQADWMFGANVFYDDDITGHNRRLGFGLEAWTDYLKMAVNSYHGITGWHQSRDFSDWDERPADGFDIRTEAYLPAHPQLGAKFMYEQYRGKEVALFGNNNRQKDPKAATMGINYTPISLLTLSTDYRQGKNSQSDAQFNIAMSYRFGVPWSVQIDPSSVGTIRTLQGSRYDLIDRNNNIILQYRKQEVISLTLPDVLNGKAGDSDQIAAIVKAKYGTERIDWDVGELVSAGGAVSHLSKQAIEIVYPPFNASGNNTYRIRAVAIGSKGNTSNRAVTEVQVSESGTSLDTYNLTLTADTDTASANGSTPITFTAKLMDKTGNALANEEVAFTFVATGGGAPVLSANSVRTQADGTATVTLTNTMAESVTVTATPVSQPSASVDTTVNFIDVTVVSLDINLSANEAFVEVIKGGNIIHMTVTARNVKGSPIPNAEVILAPGNGVAQKTTYTQFQTGVLQLNGQNATSNNLFTTGADGTVKIAITDPNGVGVKTQIKVTSGTVISSKDVIFMVLSSPYTSKANMYGHMTENVGGINRPQLHSEVSALVAKVDYKNEAWPAVSFNDAVAICGANLPSKDALLDLYNTHGNMHTFAGWPIPKRGGAAGGFYRSSTDYYPATPGALHYIVSLVDGSNGANSDASNNIFLVSCN